MSRDALKNLRKLPQYCLGVLNGRTVIITRGATNALAHPAHRTQVDYLNRKEGVTEEQRRAMEGGVTFGWNTSSADVETYTAIPNPRLTYTVQTPIIHTQSIEAFSLEDAIEIVTQNLKLPDGFEIDGSTTAKEH